MCMREVNMWIAHPLDCVLQSSKTFAVFNQLTIVIVIEAPDSRILVSLYCPLHLLLLQSASQHSVQRHAAENRV